MSVALEHQEAGTSNSGQRNIFSSGDISGSALSSKNSNSMTNQAKSSQSKHPPKSQEAEESSTLGPERYAESYTIGWISALAEEYLTAKHMLDERYYDTPQGMSPIANDSNTYIYGKIGKHFVVVGCLPMGRIGPANAATVATHMIRSFPSIKLALLVGIGGGAPTRGGPDIRVGDVVVSTPRDTHGGVVQLDYGVRLPNGLFRRRGHLNGVPDALLSAASTLEAHFSDITEPDKIAEHMKRMDLLPKYQRPSHDKLYRSSYMHVVAQSDSGEDDGDWTTEPADLNCQLCDESKLIRRRDRDPEGRKIKIHYGTIASGNQLMRDAALRDKYANDDELHVLCFEMEAAGLMNNLPCIVIRGISDYADSHKNDGWRYYAALASAAYARELLLALEVQAVVALPSWQVAIDQVNKQLQEIRESQQEQIRYTIVESHRAECSRTKEKLVQLNNAIETSEQVSNDTYEGAQNLDGTCEWLFLRDEFKSWVNTETHPVLWLSGKHGAGKTVLCAATIRHILKTDRLPPNTEKSDREPDNHLSKAIVRQFFSKDEHIALWRLFGTVAAQLLDSLLQTNPVTIPSVIEPFLNVRNDTSDKLKKLIHALLLELPLTFIFVDGLDEAEYAVAPKHPLPDDRLPINEVNKFVEFLIQQARDMPSKVRLWLSSQPLPDIRKYVCAPEWSSIVREIQMTASDTKTDIIHYFSNKMPDSTTMDKMHWGWRFLQLTLQTEVQGSFLWATYMASEFRIVENADDLLKLATTDLPLNMSAVYQRIINRIITKDSGLQDPPLWRVVLSLLAFARRPMRLDEICEAVAIYRTPDGSDIRSDGARRERILSCCLSLVRHTPGADLLRLSHSAVRYYLLDPSSQIDQYHSLVDRDIIQVCCLRYLMQPRYSFPLKKDKPNQYTFPHGTNGSSSHRFLSYAAKYWYLHQDSRDEELKDSTVASVCKFVKSQNFHTILQVQSLFIEGHFLLEFDSITDRVLSVRRTLPNWMRGRCPDLQRQYHAFQAEWCRLLQAGQSDPFGGELDRCFWRALGPNNFLSSSEGRYKNFEFSLSNSTWRKGDGCHAQSLSRDGRVLWLAWIRTRDDKNEFCFEEWTLDGTQDPHLSESTVVPFCADKAGIERYGLPCSETFRTIPVVPQMNSLVPPDGISIFDNGSIIRVGRQTFRRPPIGTLVIDSGFDEVSGLLSKDAWELICHRAPFTVACRRRLFREQPDPASMRNKRIRVEKMKQRISEYKEARTRTRSDRTFNSLLADILSSSLSRLSRRKSGRAMSNFSSETSDQSSEDSSTLSTESTDSDASDCDISLAEESWSEGSFSSDESSRNIVSGLNSDGYGYGEESDEDSELGSPESESDESSLNSLNMAEPDNNHEGSGHCSADSASVGSDQEDYETGSTDDINSGDEVSVDGILDARPAPLQAESGSRITIKDKSGVISCDSCNKRCPRTWYHCVKCQEGNVDICERCEEKGMWCLDMNHQLYKFVNRLPQTVISKRNFDVCQELAAFQTDSDGNENAAFRFKKKYSAFLHDSPPIIHETYPLVVWALTGTRLVFGDMAQNKCFEQNIKTTSSKKGNIIRLALMKRNKGADYSLARPICVSLSFSPCGTILRMAVIDAVAERLKAGKRTRNVKPQLCLNLHVLLLQLSSSQPARSPPKLLGTVSCRLNSSCARAFVSATPFAFTWSSSDLYLTISDSHLQVYRVGLPAVISELSNSQLSQKDPKATMGMSQLETRIRPSFKIWILRKIVLLPHSSRHRTVQFFPAPADEREPTATVVIGPRYSHHPTPPIGIYLREKDLGGWVNLADTENAYELRRELVDQFEEQWESDDCIIIPFDSY